MGPDQDSGSFYYRVCFSNFEIYNFVDFVYVNTFLFCFALFMLATPIGVGLVPPKPFLDLI